MSFKAIVLPQAVYDDLVQRLHHSPYVDIPPESPLMDNAMDYGMLKFVRAVTLPEDVNAPAPPTETLMVPAHQMEYVVAHDKLTVAMSAALEDLLRLNGFAYAAYTLREVREEFQRVIENDDGSGTSPAVPAGKA